MRISYRNFNITASRDKKNSPIEFSVIHKFSGLEIAYGTEHEDKSSLTTFVEHLQDLVDDYHNDPTAYETGPIDFGDDMPSDDYEYEEEIDEDAEPLESEEL